MGTRLPYGLHRMNPKQLPHMKKFAEHDYVVTDTIVTQTGAGILGMPRTEILLAHTGSHSATKQT